MPIVPIFTSRVDGFCPGISNGHLKQNYSKHTFNSDCGHFLEVITKLRYSRTSSQHDRGCNLRCSLRSRPVVTDVPPARSARAATCAPSVGNSRNHLISACLSHLPLHGSLHSHSTTIENNLHRNTTSIVPEQPLSLQTKNVKIKNYAHIIYEIVTQLFDLSVIALS